MKFLHLSDLHLGEPGRRLFGLDPWERLDACLEHASRSHGDADVLVVTGDLADQGSIEAYRGLRVRLDRLPMPYALLVGNHDDRRHFLQVFPEHGAGYVQRRLDIGPASLLMIDTSEPGREAGVFCAERRAWLERQLLETECRPVYVFLHHPPMAIGMAPIDQIRLRDDFLLETLSRASQLRHVFFGHCHRAVHGTWRGVPFSSVPSTNHQLALALDEPHDFLCTLEPPAYHVVLAREDAVLVHSEPFLHQGPTYRCTPEGVVTLT